jgi:hypothetical protein
VLCKKPQQGFIIIISEIGNGFLTIGAKVPLVGFVHIAGFLAIRLGYLNLQYFFYWWVWLALFGVAKLRVSGLMSVNCFGSGGVVSLLRC